MLVFINLKDVSELLLSIHILTFLHMTCWIVCQAQQHGLVLLQISQRTVQRSLWCSDETQLTRLSSQPWQPPASPSYLKTFCLRKKKRFDAFDLIAKMKWQSVCSSLLIHSSADLKTSQFCMTTTQTGMLMWTRPESSQLQWRAALKIREAFLLFPLWLTGSSAASRSLTLVLLLSSDPLLLSCGDVCLPSGRDKYLFFLTWECRSERLDFSHLDTKCSWCQLLEKVCSW